MLIFQELYNADKSTEEIMTMNNEDYFEFLHGETETKENTNQSPFSANRYIREGAAIKIQSGYRCFILHIMNQIWH